MTSQAKIGVKFFLASEPFHAFARLARIQRPRRQFVWKAHVERQTTLQSNLPVEQMHRLRRCQPQVGKNGLHLTLEVGFNSGANGSGSTHTTNVVPL